MPTEFEQVQRYFWERFGRGQEIVFATSSENIVTARTISAIPLNGKICFPTWSSTIKYSRLTENENVALSLAAIQMTGIAKDIGHPNNSENKEFSDKFRATFPTGFDEFCESPEAVIIEITPKEVMFDQNETGDMFKADFTKQTAENLGYKE